MRLSPRRPVSKDGPDSLAGAARGRTTLTEKEKMLAGELYLASDPELIGERERAQRLLARFNALAGLDDGGESGRILKELLGAVGDNCSIQPAFRCDYGYNIRVGRNFFANYDCVILDVCRVQIGDNVMLGPRVGIYAATHPLEADVRVSMLESGRPVSIGDNVWIGGAALILPGVSIGSNAVIGAGSVVVKDIPEGVLAVGNPCRVLRKIS